MRKYVKIIIALFIIANCVACNSNKQEDTTASKQDLNEEKIQIMSNVLAAFEKLNAYDGEVKINEIRSNISHADNKEIPDGILEQDKYKITINPKKNEGTFYHGFSMYNIFNKNISMYGDGGSDIEMTYDNLLKDYVKDKKPYYFTLKDNKITKTDKSPAFYCEGCKGAYYGKTRNDTEAYLVDSFTEDDIAEGSARSSVDEYQTYFHWIQVYIERIDDFKNSRSDMSNLEEDYSRLNIESQTNGENTTLTIKKDCSKLYEYEKQELLTYLEHGNMGIWELVDIYINVEIDKDGYPISYENMINAKHIKEGTIIPLYTKTTFEREK